MKSIQVFLLPVEEERLALLDSSAEEGDRITFAEPAAAFHLSKNRAFVVLAVGPRRRVLRAAVGHRGYSAGTALSQVHLTNATKIASPFRIAGLPSLVKRRHKSRVRSWVESFGLLTPKASNDLLENLVTRHPELGPVIDAAKMANEITATGLAPQIQLRLQEEKDAAYTAMTIAGFDRKKHLMNATASVGADRWFLDRVTESRLREDPMLVNDLNVFPDFERVSGHIAGAARFEQRNVQLTIVLIHRQPLEEVIGSDLIYFNETFGAFVMVQYKAMEPDKNGHVFRLPNDGLTKELERMKGFQQTLAETAGRSESVDSAAFRFSTSPFFLKFCPRIVTEIADRDLVPGLYFPIEHWFRLSKGVALEGERHGKALRYDNASPVTNADRYLNNTEFANLVRGAWVGTSPDQSELLQRLIEDTLSQGRSVTLAVAREVVQSKDQANP